MRKRNKKFRHKKAVIASVLVVAIGAGAVLGYNIIGKKRAVSSGQVINTDTVIRDNIEVSITGSASVQPYERYEIISMVSGDVLSAPFDVGDTVNKGDILYRFDSSDQQSSLQKQELSLRQSRNNLADAKEELSETKEKLSIRASNSGIISDLDIKKGTEISANQKIATIVNTIEMEAVFPFTQSQINNMYIGQEATVSSSAHMSTVSGKVENISSNPTAQEDGSNVYDVTITFTNPGAFTTGLTVGASVGDMHSPGYGTVKPSESGETKSQLGGDVTEVYFSNGDYVNEGDIIATISSDTIKTQQRSIENSEINLKNAELSMQDARDNLDNYSITAPISGTVITKNAKAGDTIDRTNSTTTLMVIADVSRLKFNLEIDELDVSSVSEGQRVSITCDALPNERFEGEITGVSVEGTATNGVTTYTADVVINNPGNLRPSMNIDASVIIESAQNVLVVPSADVKTAMGVSYVFLKDETGQRGATEEDFANAMRKKMMSSMPKSVDGGEMQGERPQMQGGEMPQGERPQMSNIEMTQDEKTEDKSKNTEQSGKNNEKQKERNSFSRLPEAPEGFVVAIVETGLSNDEYTEIKSGLNEFDQIQQLAASMSQSNMMFGMRSGMGGGMPTGMGGGMPSGMPGGMRR
ncbi:MAG: HlyD family efflux transporter periplasmic adaptor subunit [Clostridia bacterium]|nr:HlyD family efflux transporter periplasmic adaptor subunit [Clostridia bacterium]